MLSPKLQALWDEYLRQERQSVRSPILPTLENFIDALARTSVEYRTSWALKIAEAVVDQKKGIPVRLPLFRKVLFPALLSGYREQIPGCARWLAGFYQLLYNSPGCLDQLSPNERFVPNLLRAALQVDPNDTRSRGQLIGVLASHLEYAIHEVPSGVLFGSNGASIAECDLLVEELDEFSRLASADGCIERYRGLVDDCRLHFVAYRDYLGNRAGCVNYGGVP